MQLCHLHPFVTTQICATCSVWLVSFKTATVFLSHKRLICVFGWLYFEIVVPYLPSPTQLLSHFTRGIEALPACLA